VITQTISADLDLSVGGGGTRSFNAAPNATLLLSGTISGSGAWQKLGLGTLSLTGPNTVTGIVSIQTGTVQISSIGNNSVSSALGAGDSFRVGTGANTATLSLVGSSSAQSSDRQLIVGSGGTAVSTGGAIIRNDNANSAHTLTFVNSTFNVAVGTGGANATRTITLGGINTGNNTIEGSIINQNATTGIIALEKADAGTWVLSGNSTFTGATAVTGGTLSLARVGGPCLGSTASVSVGSGATLLISQSEQVSSSAAVSLSGGTISRASGTSETFGTLNLTADSALDFLSGTAGNMTFGAYEGNTVPSHKLTVNNFFAGNTLVFGSDLGTGGPLSPNIIPASFTGTSFTSTWFNINSTSGGFTSVWNGSTFTITAIPEPSTYVAALGLAGLMLWPLRRRVVALGRIRFR
jgi:fibronectin-binding autotransporter adhesin